MKAVVVTGDCRIVIKELPVPEITEYEVLVENLYGSICTGTDLQIIDGTLRGIQYPAMLGHESVGRVIRIGEKVKNYALGDLVTSAGAKADVNRGLYSHWGGFAEYGVATDYRVLLEDGLHEQELMPYKCNQKIPAGLPPLEATMIITWRETLSYISRVGVASGDNIMLLGSGSVGLAFANHIVNLGAQCIVIGNPCMKGYFSDIGVHHFYDYKHEDVVKQIQSEHHPSFNCLIDAVGSAEYTQKLLALLPGRGKVGVYGLKQVEDYKISPLSHKGSITFCNYGYDPEEVHEQVVASMLCHQLCASNWYTPQSVFVMDEIAEAVEQLRQRKIMKAVIKIK
ncbi:2-deoxy-scyllo-inosamine dehydrogenase [compost metagenome]